MSEFLLEVLAEEIPAGVLPGARAELLHGVARALASAGINGKFFVYSTSRRLVLVARELPEKQEDRDVEVVGPSVKVAFDAEGLPTKAAEGFARGQGIPLASLSVVTTPKGDYVAARKIVAGRYTEEVLAEVVPPVLEKMTFPRMMRWGNGEHCWVRPVHSIVALFDGLVVPFTLFGVETGRVTVGHRILAAGRVIVRGADDYLEKLRASCVEPDFSARREALLEKANALAAEVGGLVSADAALFDTLAHLVELPGLVRGSFQDAYLELPEEILVTTMREHQKVLPIRGESGELTPHFLAVADNATDPKGLIARGNEWVLNARFADAKFFWEEDARVRLEDRLPALERLQFQERLGDMLQKTGRIQELAERLAQSLDLGGFVMESVRAARLLKTDLVTDMVREFPDLQGVVGGLYAQREGEADDVWQAVYDHYLPAGGDDPLPRSETGCVVALADRLDTLTGFFALGLVPTGSKDPYALRRAALGVVRILLEKGWYLDLPAAVSSAHGLYGVLPCEASEVKERLMPFLLERLRFLLEKKGHKHDEIEAVLTTACPDIVDAADRVASVAAIRLKEDFVPLSVAFKRVQNILTQAGEGEAAVELDPALVTEDAERQLAGDFFQAKEMLDDMIDRRNYADSLSVMASLGPSLDRFFAEVMVMVEDEAVRRNRIALLRAMRDEFFRVARFSEIQA